MKKNLKLRKLVKDINLKVLAGEKGLDYYVHVEMISRPGFEIAGIFEFSDPERLMLIGVKESNYIATLSQSEQKRIVRALIELKPPAIIFPVNPEIDQVLDIFIELGDELGVPILRSDLNTTPLNSQLYVYLHKQLTDKIGVHGVLMDITEWER